MFIVYVSYAFCKWSAIINVTLALTSSPVAVMFPVTRLNPNEHTVSNPRGFDVDITSIRQKLNFDEFLRYFRVLFRCIFDGRKTHVVSMYSFRGNFAGRKIHVISTYFFWCNFAGRKIYVVSTYSFLCNFDGRKIHVVSMYFFWCNFDGRKIHVASMYFFRCNFDGRKINVVSTYFYWCNFAGQKNPRCFHVLFSI